MRDLLGNPITPGTLLWWLSKNIPIRVARIDEPSTVTINRQPQKTKLVLELTIPLDATTEGVETQVTDFLCIVNPDADKLISGILEGTGKIQ